MTPVEQPHLALRNQLTPCPEPVAWKCALAMIAEFESDLIKMRTREGMRVAKAKGRLRGKQPKLKPAQEAHLVELWRAGKHTSAEFAELFSVARSTVYRAVQRAGEPKSARARRVSAHVFVDETKQRGYLLVASVVVPSDLDSVRRMLRGLVLHRHRDRRQRRHRHHLRRWPALPPRTRA